MSAPIIEAQGLIKSYGTFKAVDELSFELHEGSVMGFLGPNGAGKSTTLRMLVNLIRPVAGNLRLFGWDYRHHRGRILSRIGCLIEKPDFYKYLGALQNLELLGRASGIPNPRGRALEMLEFVGLTGRERDPVSSFSHGMRQRLGLAQCLLHNPDLIILDEPGTGLDPQGIVDMREMILNLNRQQGKTILLSSHHLPEVEAVATHLVLMNRGRCLVQGSASELLSRQDRQIHLEVDNAHAAMNCLSHHLSFDKIYLSDDNHLELALNREQLPAMLKSLVESGIAVYAVESRQRLEDYYMQILHQNNNETPHVAGLPA
jgi:ABC-2 type transport system ATP-binding protein